MKMKNSIKHTCVKPYAECKKEALEDHVREMADLDLRYDLEWPDEEENNDDRNT